MNLARIRDCRGEMLPKRSNLSDLSAWVDDALMDIEYVNERLAEIPESGRLDD